jgi:hypothetical protein
MAERYGGDFLLKNLLSVELPAAVSVGGLEECAVGCGVLL